MTGQQNPLDVLQLIVLLQARYLQLQVLPTDPKAWCHFLLSRSYGTSSLTSGWGYLK